MKSDTRRRIQIYEGRLPHIREKLSAAALGLVVAALVAVSASFAWVTLSRSPEVANIATTISANGSLEIALSNPEGTAPSDADIDESVTKSVNVVSSNLQWGNLVNLNDASYGIDNLELRPAQLNTVNLLKRPLMGVLYGADGRITEKDYDFAYTNYDATAKKFLTSDTAQYGVRAISTVEVTKDELADAVAQTKEKAVQTAVDAVNTCYQDKVVDKFSGLGEILSKYAQDKLNSGNSNLAPYLESVVVLYRGLYETMEKQQDAYAALANYQQYKSLEDTTKFQELSWNDINKDKNKYNAATLDGSANNAIGVHLTGLNVFINDFTQLGRDLAALETKLEAYKTSQTPCYWSDLQSSINNLISMYTMYAIVNGEKLMLTSISMNDATKLLNAVSGKTVPVYVDGGILKRFETGVIENSYRLNGNAKCEIKVLIFTIKGAAYTTAADTAETSWFASEFARVQAADASAVQGTAQDTYGMVVDFWIRSNAEETVLTLEGAVATNSDGTVVSYDGVNRVWGYVDPVAPTTNSTSQGGGSCYVFYADTPEEQTRSLAMLQSMKVAFMDTETGKWLATASMDTENYWAENGRITVPLVIDTTGNKVSYDSATGLVIDTSSNTDDSGTTDTDTTTGETGKKDEEETAQPAYGITTLRTDESRRISAIVYLDGMTLDNTDVLAENSVQGRLNLQFGSSVSLETLGSNDLLYEERTVTASADHTSFDYSNYTGGDSFKTTVTLTFKGSEPENSDIITAYFVRAINSAQGSRETQMTFTKQSDGWVGTHSFNAPGTYYLRYVSINGVEYALEEPVTVTVTGFKLSSVTWDQTEQIVGGEKKAVVRTSANSHSVTVTATFAADSSQKQPATVKASFVGDNGNMVTIPLTSKGNSTWEGTGTFTGSGVYTLSYLIYTTQNSSTELYTYLEGMTKKIDLSLGLYAVVNHSSNNNGIGPDDKVEFESGKTYTPTVMVRIYDNAGNLLAADVELSDDLQTTQKTVAWLYYYNGSVSGAIPCKMSWDNVSSYMADIPIAAAGKWQFLKVTLDGQDITRAASSPTYTIISPDPVEYDKSSQTTYTGDNIQFVPLTNDAVIDNVRIKYSNSTNTVQALVYNADNDYWTLAKVESDGTVGTDGVTTKWRIELPTYTVGEGESAATSQDGTWTVAALLISNCYGSDKEFHGDDDPILWAGSDQTSQTIVSNYLSASDAPTPTLRVDTMDFSKLTTTVSGTVNVTFAAGKTSLGDASTAFMTEFNVENSTGMSLSIKDDAGRVIPSDKVHSVTLNVKYDSDASCGYETNSSAQVDTTIDMVYDTVSQTYKPAADTVWKYAGKYTVSSVDVTFVNSSGASAQSMTKDVNTVYTVTTAGPTASNVKLYRVDLDNVVTVGRTGNSATGQFLDSYGFGRFAVRATITDGNGGEVTGASLGDIGLTLELTYEGGSETYGHYTMSNNPTGLTLPMKLDSEGRYMPEGNLTLPAGTYTARATGTYNGTSLEFKYVKGNTALEVYSAQPDVTITGVTPAGEVQVNANTDKADNHLTANASTFTGTNQFGDHYAVVYMEYAAHTAESNKATGGGALSSDDTYTLRSTEYANYTAPTVTMKATGYGNAELTLIAGDNTVTLTDGSGELVVGTVEEKSYDRKESYYTYTYHGDTATLLGTQTISTVTSTVNGVTYTRELKTPIVISQTNQQNPELTVQNGNGVTITVSDGTTTYTPNPSGTYAIPVMKTLTATATVTDGYHTPELTAPEGVYDWKLTSSDKTTATYTFKMSVGNTTLTGSATQYPTVTFSGDANATVAVTVDGSSKATGTGVKPGSTVTVTVTANSETNHRCLPKLTALTGVNDWTANEGDFVSEYKFTMPNSAVSLATPTTTAMHQLTWENNSAVKFNVRDTNTHDGINKGDYVVPGHTLEITLDSSGQGDNPVLEEPKDANCITDTTGAYSIVQYQYTMPHATLTLKASAHPYTVVKLDNQYADFTILNAGSPIEDYVTGQGVSIAGGNVVTITLTPKTGYYAPRMTEPVGVTEWKQVSATNESATYTFKKGSGDVDVGAKITATTAPTVTLNDGNATLAISYTTYAGTTTNNPNVQPGQTVTVTATYKSGYYNPTVTASGVTLSGRTAGANNGYDTATYTFTMGTSNVTLTPNATPDPTVTYSITKHANVKQVTVSNLTNGTKIHPGTTTTVTVTGKKIIVVGQKYPTEPTYTGTLLAKEWSLNGTVGTYTFTMGTTDVKFTFDGK